MKYILFLITMLLVFIVVSIILLPMWLMNWNYNELVGIMDDFFEELLDKYII